MRIVFLHVYSERNTGDAAIVSVMLADYRTRYPGAQIVLSALTTPDNPTFEDAPYVGSFFGEAIYVHSHPLLRILRTVSVVARTFLFLAVYKTTKLKPLFLFPSNLGACIREIVDCDKVVGVGGGYIIGKKGLASMVSLFLTLFEFWFCLQLKKPVTLYAQSIGPFVSPLQRWLTKRILNCMEQITVREDISRQLVLDLGINQPVLRRGYDAAFFFRTHESRRIRNMLMKRGIFFTKPVVGITVRRCFASPDEQIRYEQAFACCAHTMAVEYGMKVVFIPHVTATEQNDDDRLIQERIRHHMKPHRDIVFLNEVYTCYETKAIYENCDLLIGTRMHSVIFALTAEVPSLAIAYEPKTLGVMKQLGLEKWMMMVEEVDQQTLPRLAARLIKHRSEYKHELKKIFPLV